MHGRTSRPSSEADTNLYDVAFPDQRRVISSGDYATARHPDKSQYVPGKQMPPRRLVTVTKVPSGGGSGGGGSDTTDGAQRQEPKKSLPPTPTGMERKVSDDGLTSNPLYGSQDRLLSDIAALDFDEHIREMEAESAALEGHNHSGIGAAAALPESLDVDESEMTFTTNPMYGELEPEQKKQEMEKHSKLGTSAVRQDTEAGEKQTDNNGLDHESSSREEGNSHLCESEQNLTQGSSHERETEGEQPTSAAAGENGIERDAKGYSKVDKSKKVNSSDPGNSDGVADNVHVAPPLERQVSEDPPPLPERKYSYDESELNQPPSLSENK